RRRPAEAVKVRTPSVGRPRVGYTEENRVPGPAGCSEGLSSCAGTTGPMACKHIFVTGGVVSSLGKGLTCASIGMLLERRGLRVRLQKFDPYINVDPGTSSPYQQGEVSVLDDASEPDLALGHYERFTNAPLTKQCNYTTGKISLSVIQKEREG